MADLEAMREFQNHWEAYQADERAIALLRTRPPFDVSALSDADRAQPPCWRPASAAYDEPALAAALERVSPSASVVPDGVAAARWGWWLDDSAWQAVRALGGLLDERAAALAALAGIELASWDVHERDEALRAARQAVATFEAANDADRTQCAELTQRRVAVAAGAPVTRTRQAGAHAADGDAAAPARTPWWRRLWDRLVEALLGRRRRQEELDALAQRIDEVNRNIELRDKEIARLGRELAARTEELRAPFAVPADSAEEAVAAVERRIVELMDRDLAARDEAYEAGSLDGLPFVDALAAANRREWDLLAAWMASYTEQLPSLLEHVGNVAESELVWLEGHAPYGKRYWPLTDEVVAFMASGKTEQSEVALGRCLAERAN